MTDIVRQRSRCRILVVYVIGNHMPRATRRPKHLRSADIGRYASLKDGVTAKDLLPARQVAHVESWTDSQWAYTIETLLCYTPIQFRNVTWQAGTSTSRHRHHTHEENVVQCCVAAQSRSISATNISATQGWVLSLLIPMFSAPSVYMVVGTYFNPLALIWSCQCPSAAVVLEPSLDDSSFPPKS